ncbi:MAG: DUF3696 domain-containing protein [Ktedonobacteraceae bacterium]
MLKSWSIENFKPIVNSGELKLAPVTVLAGRNSSGKSSLLQSILMIAQTLSNPLPERALLPNGPLVQLGTFEDILSDFSNSRHMVLKFELSFDREDIGEDYIDLYRTSNYKVLIKFSGANYGNVSLSAIEASKVLVDEVLLEFNFEFSGTDSYDTIGQNTLVVMKILEEDLKRYLEDVPPELYPRLLPYISERPNYLGKFTLHSEDPSEQFLIPLSHFLPSDLVSKPRKDDILFGYSGYRGEIEASNEQITRFFSSQIRYLGPIRADLSTTRRTFALSSELDDVGDKGEYAAVAYHYNRFATIEWYNPYTQQLTQGALQDALDCWIRHLGVAEEVRTEESGSMGVAWKVVIKQGQKARTLPEVGVGVGQVLPVLVMGLLSPSNTLLLMEQPELHLHPSVQARLGDFFVGMSKCKKQFLIETHSENLVSQLRYHIVQAGGIENSDCMIYFVDRDEKGEAKFEQVAISPQGNILNWPDGFFDETMLQEDRITAASIKKRAAKAKNA